MAPLIRNTGIYVLAAICAVILVSRFVTVALMLMHAPEDANPYFYLKKISISAICVGSIIWIWSKRIRQDVAEKRGT